MDHRDISNGVDSACAFRVAGEATTNVSYCSVRKFATKLFYLSVLIFGFCLHVYLSSQKVRNSRTLGRSVFSTWFRKLTVGPFTEPGILLQIASIRTNTSGHCLNCYVSRPVFTYYSVIMCNCHEVSIDILVVTPAY